LFPTIGSKYSKLEIDRAKLIADHISKMQTNKTKIPMSPTDRKQYLAIQKRNQRAIQKQKKSSTINLITENNEQNEKSSSTDVIPTSNFSKQNEQQLSTNLLSPSSNISNFNLLLLTNSISGKINDHNQNLLSESIISYGTSDSDLESIKKSDGHLTGSKIIEKTIIIICDKYVINIFIKLIRIKLNGYNIINQLQYGKL